MKKQRMFTAVIVLLFVLLLLAEFMPRRDKLVIGIFAGSNWDVPTADGYGRIEKAIALFKERYPEVTIEFQSGIRSDDYEEWLARQLLQDQMPDVFFVPSQLFTTLANNGSLLNLTSLSMQDSSFDTQNYYETALKAGMINDTLYALPYESVPTLMFVNKTLLNQEGISMPDNDWTWDDFYTICKAVSKDIDGDGKQEQFGFYDYTWEDALYSTGISFYDADHDTANLSSTQAVEAVSFLRKLNALNTEKVTAELFDKGQVAFQPMNYSDYRTYMPYPWRVKKYSNFEWDCLPMPASTNGGNISQIDTLMVGLSSKSRNQQLAWEFMKLLSCDEVFQSEVAKESQAVSVLKSVMTSENVIEALKEDNPGESNFEMTLLNEVMEQGIVLRKTKQYDQIVQIADAQISELMNNDADIENGLAKIQRQIDAYLRR